MSMFERARFVRLAIVLAVALALLLSGVVVGAAGGPLIMGAANSAGTTDTSLTTGSTGTALLTTQTGTGTALRGVATNGIAGFFTSANGSGVSGVVAANTKYGVFGANDAAAFGGGAAVRASGQQNHGLVATTANASADAVRAINTGGGQALDLVVNSDVPPMSVNSNIKVVNLNVDLLDGLNSTDFAEKVPEAWVEVGAFGQCDISGAQHWTNVDSNHNSAAYFKDPSGVVHLKGLVRCTGALNGLFDIFVLPEGYRPAKREAHGTIAGDVLARIDIATDGKLILIVGAAGAATYLSLDGITFRAAP